MRFWATSTVLLLVGLQIAEAKQQHHAAHHPSHAAAHHKAAAHHGAAQHHQAAHHSNAGHHPAQHSNAHHPNGHNAHHPAGHNEHHGHKETHHAHKNPAGTLRMSETNSARIRAIKAGTLCGDLATNCHQVDSMCTEGEFASVFRKYCKKNCGFCAAPMDSCKDKADAATCRKWKKGGFCTSSNFPLQTRRVMCAKTCNLCGGKVDCTDGPNKWLNQCLHETCKDPSEQKRSKCKEYCKTHKKLCGEDKPSKECQDATKKYDSECIEQTCSAEPEKTTPTQPCIDWCQKNPTKAVCQKAATCTDAGKKYDPECLSTTCNTTEERANPSQQCKDFCQKSPNEPACKPLEICKDTKNQFAKECIADTCDSDAQQKTPTQECLDYCRDNPTSKGCDTLPNPACNAADKKYTELCLRQTCSDTAEKTNDPCKLYCGRKAPDTPNAKACENVTPIDCDAAADEKTPQCIAHFCAKASSKNDPACQTTTTCQARRAAPVPFYCEGVLVPDHDPDNTKNCDQESTDLNKFNDRCGPYWCMKPAEKPTDNCRNHCPDANAANLECIGVPPAPTNPPYGTCDTPGQEYSTVCLPYTCRKLTTPNGPKENEHCINWCETPANQANPACRGVKPKADPNCDPDDKKWTDNCINHTCRDHDNKDKPQCRNYCATNTGAGGAPIPTACLL